VTSLYIGLLRISDHRLFDYLTQYFYRGFVHKACECLAFLTQFICNHTYSHNIVTPYTVFQKEYICSNFVLTRLYIYRSALLHTYYQHYLPTDTSLLVLIIKINTKRRPKHDRLIISPTVLIGFERRWLGSLGRLRCLRHPRWLRRL
jgi:hypothetical protein